MKEGKPTLEEQRNNIRLAIARATGREDKAEVERLTNHLVDIQKKIEEQKNE